MRSRIVAIIGILSLTGLTACAARLTNLAGDQAAYAPEESFAEFEIAEEMAFEEDFAGRAAGAPAPQASNIAMDADDAAFLDGEQQVQLERLIIRTGTLSIEAEDTLETQEAIEDIVDRFADEGAFVVSSNESGGTGDRQPSISMSIRIPSSEFDDVMDEIADLALEVNFRDQSGQDVTEEFVDLSARIESLEAARDRLLEIIQEAQTTEDLLLAEQQLTQREAEIESLKGRAQFLQESARLSSITVSIDPFILNQPIDNRWRPSETVRRALENFVEGVQDLIDFFILFGIGVLPFLLLFGGIIYLIVRGIVRWVRRRRGRASNTEDDEEDTN